MDDHAYLKAFSEALTELNVTATARPYLSIERLTDFLFYTDPSGRRIRPLALRLRTGRDDADDLAAFCSQAATPTRSGTIRRLYIQNAEAVPPEDVARRVALWLMSEPWRDEAIRGEEWLDDRWEDFDPVARAEFLGATVARPEPASPTVAAEEVWPEHVDFHEPDLRPVPHRHRSDRVVVTAGGDDRFDLAHVVAETDRKGFGFERAFAEAMDRLGLRYVSRFELDRVTMTDFLVYHLEGGAEIWPVAIQVTLSWNDLIKMEDFLDSPYVVQIHERTADRLYIQVAHGTPPELVAEGLAKLLGGAAANRPRAGKAAAAFAECDVANGLRQFDVQTRLERLNTRANPHLSAPHRRRGVVQALGDGGFIIRDTGASVHYFARPSEIVDRSLRRAYQSSSRGNGTFLGSPVSFIPHVIGSNAYDLRALSVLGSR